MTKAEIKQRFKQNYLDRLTEHLKTMQKQGYLLAKDNALDNIYLMQFNVNDFKFNSISTVGESFKHLNFEQVDNPFKIILDNSDYIDLILNNLVMADSDDLYRYTRYEVNIEKLVPKNEMQADLKSYLNLSKKLAGEFEKNTQDTPQTQAQILAGANVFYTGRDNSLRITETNKYYQWDKTENKFKLLTSKDIQKLIFNVTGGEPKLLEIETNMRTVYHVIVTNTSFPVQWNNQKDLQAKIKQDKKGHDKIEKIVATFE